MPTTSPHHVSALLPSLHPPCAHPDSARALIHSPCSNCLLGRQKIRSSGVCASSSYFLWRGGGYTMAATFGGPLPVCRMDQPCLAWVRKFFKDCVCSGRDQASFVLGLSSVFCWGVAEVPQIITNCREQSTEGVSLAFLMTWVLGDFFNLAGCYLEPSTLPTQFYMALLYTITTLILVGQVIYYDHILKRKKLEVQDLIADKQEEVPSSKIQEKSDAISVAPPPALLPSRPIAAIPSPRQTRRSGRDLYYTSARSLTSSHTPTAGSYLAGSRGGSGGVGGASAYSLLHHNSLEESTNGHLLTSHSAPSVNPSSTIIRALVSSAMCVGGFSIHGRFKTQQRVRPRAENPIFIGRPARKLLEARLNDRFNVVLYHASVRGTGSLGVWFGWMMAAIYMGGRIPQIWLNIKRGSVEGLNPLMFTFALLGNVTYVGSILVRTTEWRKIKSNMPWLVDAGVCVLLDCFILGQFVYYHSRKSRDNGEHKGECYKPLE